MDRETREANRRSWDPMAQLAESFREFNRIMATTSDSFRKMVAALATTGRMPPVPHKRSKWSGYGRGYQR